MNLLEQGKERFFKMKRVSSCDGMGGTKTEAWERGEPFWAVLGPKRAFAVDVAAQKRERKEYTVIFSDDIFICFHDVFCREADGAVFRMTSDITQKAPLTAAFAWKKASAEEWRLI